MTIVFQEDWTGTDGAAWNSGRWPDISGIGTSAATIQTNRGRLAAQGAAYQYVRARGTAGASISDLIATATFTFGTGANGDEQYHTFHFRRGTAWSINNADVPADGYAVEFQIFSTVHALKLYKTVASVRTTLNDISFGPWGTSPWNLKVQAIGSALKVKVWQGSEPGTWNIEQTDASHTTGDIGLASVNGSLGVARTMDWDSMVVDNLVAAAAYEQSDFQFFNDNGIGLGPPP